MAGPEAGSTSQRLQLNCYDTALCVIAPRHYCQEVDKLRELYDKGYGRWPPHINLLYPFVAVENLAMAKELIEARVKTRDSPSVRLNDAGCFTHRQGHTVFACENESNTSALGDLRDAALEALGHRPTAHRFHLTIGQSADHSLAARDFLLSKASYLPPCEFKLDNLVILSRERTLAQDKTMNFMKLWGTIPFRDAAMPTWPTPDFWIDAGPRTMSEAEEQHLAAMGQEADIGLDERAETTYTFDIESSSWKALQQPLVLESPEFLPSDFKVASYNVLADAGYPPSGERTASILRVILSKLARAEILLLQEVSDDFLISLLSEDGIRDHYTYVSHAPPTQTEVGPLPSLRNIVMLSCWPFEWHWLPFQRRHKGAVIARINGLGISNDAGFHPLVVAGIHLTSGLTDGSVAAKRIQIDRLLNHIKRKYTSSPSIVAGDFNLTTSSFTVDLALADKSITQQTVETLASIELNILESEFLDAWAVARVEASDESAFSMESDHELFEGEAGATFDPRNNPLATESSGTSQNRPQRYDRVLYNGKSLLRTQRFNQFGRSELEGETDASEQPSDHYGVRASFSVIDDDSTTTLDIKDVETVQPKSLPENLKSTSLIDALSEHDMFPTEEEDIQRRDAFLLLKEVLQGSDGENTQTHMLLELVTVGSYALGVWTASSDIDCLCIGNISSKTFFKLARQRIKKAEARGIRILRKVEANSGTLLEIVVNEVLMDLHYCPATRVVEQWPKISRMPASDATFNLPMLSLRKLKPYRDLEYIQRTIPDMAVFRAAYRCLKLWAIQQGLYSARFGYMGGIHLTLLLSIVHKRVVYQSGTVTAECLVATFFHFYANFDWKTSMVFDPFFHKQRPRYHRTAREPMVILGYHAPNANVAHTSTVPGLDVLVKEFQEADRRLSSEAMTWKEFFAAEGLSKMPSTFTFDTYVRIDVQYWGQSQAKGKTLVGWLESRCLLVVVEINKLLPNLEVRIWPARFTQLNTDAAQDCQGCYLIGLARKDTSDTIPDKQIAMESLTTALRSFENQLRGDKKYYDTETSWIGVSLVRRNQLEALEVDHSAWGDALAADDEDQSESDDEIEPDADDLENAAPFIQSLPVRPRGKAPDAKKLRPASDILSRLRWDPSFDMSDFVVGYEDRFLGAQETSLERWKLENTDEEFIPQHRILYFRRKSDGLVVWERQGRIDRIFGSGVGAGA